MSRCDIQTFCFGLAASMGAFLLGAGVKGKRQSMPNARIMIHQPLGGASGQVRTLLRTLLIHGTRQTHHELDCFLIVDWYQRYKSGQVMTNR